MEGEHSFVANELVNVSNIHNLTLKGQGHWPVAGAEETVMQSTVIINCTRGRGGFYFTTSHNITVEGLTVINCIGFLSPTMRTSAVFYFEAVANLFFCKNSIQHMTGNGLFVLNCENVTVTNCSYYHSVFCDRNSQILNSSENGGAVGIMYNRYTQYSNTGYTLELSHSNMTKCCNHQNGGGIWLKTYSQFDSVTVLFSYLVLSHNKARQGGGLAVELHGHGNVTLKISNCLFSHGSALHWSGGMYFSVSVRSWITVENTNLVENSAYDICEIRFFAQLRADKILLSLLNSTILHTQNHSYNGIRIHGCCFHITLNNTRMRFDNIIRYGLMLLGESRSTLQMVDSQLEGSHNLKTVISLRQILAVITNCTFSNNSGSDSVISIFPSNIDHTRITSSIIADNNMTGITLINTGVRFIGRNVIQNNRNTEGAGIKLVQHNAYIEVDGELFLVNNTADLRGGAILVSIIPPIDIGGLAFDCSIRFISDNSSVTFSGNRAGKGGSDIYNAMLINCYYMYNSHGFVKHVGHPKQISWYFDTRLMKYLHFSNTDQLSSMSSDPIMVCFCNTTSNLPDCSDRTQHHIEAYPGLVISTSIATVGYYGGASPGDVLVSAQRATLVRYYGQSSSTCFQLHILLQNTTSTTALVNIRVDGGLYGWGVSIIVGIKDCPIGFTEDKISGQCRCEQLLDSGNVQCNVSLIPFKFLRSGNSWFANNNNTQCITGTTSCPFDYCNRSDVSFDLMAPDRQCLGNRAGILCGQCQSHLSIMLGSNRCGACSNWYIFLLPVFALAGIVLVAVLMFLKLSVSVGTINGLLFYANMVKLNEVFFFPNGSVPVVSQFISWLNLDLGIEVCLFDGLDGYWNTWLQFAFPAYLFLLMGGIIVGCRYSVWLCRLCGSHAVPALATLFLMSYTKILLTVTNALSLSQLPCNDSILTVWSVDGNIEYGSGKHLVLVLVSCGVLVVGLAYPVLVLCAPLLEKYSHKCIPQHRWNPVARLKPLLDAYGGPYKDKYRFWTGVTRCLPLPFIRKISCYQCFHHHYRCCRLVR